MKKYMKLVLGVLALVIVLGGSYVLYQYLSNEYSANQDLLTKGEAEENEEKDEKIAAMDFAVQDQDGKTRLLSSFAGKPVILNFWASWCGPCKQEFPEFQKAYEEYGQDIAFVMVNLTDGLRETVKTASDFIQSEGYTFPVYYDTTEEAASNYAVFSIPTTYFIDKDGYIAAGVQGMLNESTLQKGIAMIQ